jgi:hypothetical protein
MAIKIAAAVVAVLMLAGESFIKHGCRVVVQDIHCAC